MKYHVCSASRLVPVILGGSLIVMTLLVGPIGTVHSIGVSASLAVSLRSTFTLSPSAS